MGAQYSYVLIAWLCCVATMALPNVAHAQLQQVSIANDGSSGSEVREWQFLIDSAGDVKLNMYDESNNASIGRRINTPLVLNLWTFVVARYDGGTDAANIDIFKDGLYPQRTRLSCPRCQ